MQLERLEVTDEIRAGITAVERGQATFRSGASDASYTEVVELPMIQLANAVLRAVADQAVAPTAAPNATTAASSSPASVVTRRNG